MAFPGRLLVVVLWCLCVGSFVVWKNCSPKTKNGVDSLVREDVCIGTVGCGHPGVRAAPVRTSLANLCAPATLWACSACTRVSVLRVPVSGDLRSRS